MLALDRDAADADGAMDAGERALASRTTSNSAAMAIAIAPGCFPLIATPWAPMGQWTRASASAAQPRAASRRSNWARFDVEPIKPM